MNLTNEMLAELHAEQQAHPGGTQAGLRLVIEKLFSHLVHENHRLREQLYNYQFSSGRHAQTPEEIIKRLSDASDNHRVVYHWLQMFRAEQTLFFEEALAQMVLQLCRELRMHEASHRAEIPVSSMVAPYMTAIAASLAADASHPTGIVMVPAGEGSKVAKIVSECGQPKNPVGEE